MKRIIQLIGIATISSNILWAGNPDRAGGAGATQLLINPYAKSAALASANTGSIRGLESFQFNIAGLAYTNKTEVGISRVIYLQGADVFVNNLSIAQNLGNGNVIGLNINALDFGDIQRTTVAEPDNTLGTYSPTFLNIGLAYAKKFSNSITGGLDIRLISEGIDNVGASGIGISAGVQYQTSITPKKKAFKKEDFKFGISVRNIGANMQQSGSGLSTRGYIPSSNGTLADRRVYMGSQGYNLPTLVHLGLSYDMRLDGKESTTYNHKLTTHANFNYNAFSSNIFAVGADYGFKDMFFVRAGYAFQNGSFDDEEYTNQMIGPTAGLGFSLPISKSGSKMNIDYAYAPTRVFNGIHNLTLAFVIDYNK